MEVSIVIPTYNERENITKLIPHIEDVLSKNSLKGEIIIIDDNSPDGTGRIADKLAKRYKNIRVIHRTSKKGVGSARKLGFSEAKKDIIISMEGDTTHNPDFIPHFLKAIKEGADLVIGSRYLPKSKIINWPLKRRVVSKFANKIANIFAGAKLTDVTSGYRAFTKKMYSKLYIESLGYPFNMEFACESWYRGFRIKEIPITFVHRKKGKSKLSVLKEFITFLRVVFKFSYTYRPVAVFGSLGGILTSVGFIVGLYVVYLELSGRIESRFPLLILSLLLIVAGIQIFSFGLIVNVISKFRKEALK